MDKLLDKTDKLVDSMTTMIRHKEQEVFGAPCFVDCSPQLCQKRTEWALPPKVEEGMTGVSAGIPPLHNAAKHGDVKVARCAKIRVTHQPRCG